MERIVLFSALVLFSAMFFFTPAGHAWRTDNPGIHQRFENQEQRISRGISSGRLTPYETARLWDIQARIRHEEMLMKSDGRLTGMERIRLHHNLNRSSKAIFRMKHNGRFAY